MSQDPNDPKSFGDAFQRALKDNKELQGAIRSGKIQMADLASLTEAYSKHLKSAGEYLEEQLDTIKQFGGKMQYVAGLIKGNVKLFGDSAEALRLDEEIARDLVDALNDQLQLSVIQNTTLQGIYAQKLAQYMIEEGITSEQKQQEFLLSDKGKQMQARASKDKPWSARAS